MAARVVQALPEGDHVRLPHGAHERVAEEPEPDAELQAVVVLGLRGQVPEIGRAIVGLDQRAAGARLGNELLAGLGRLRDLGVERLGAGDGCFQAEPLPGLVLQVLAAEAPRAQAGARLPPRAIAAVSLTAGFEIRR